MSDTARPSPIHLKGELTDPPGRGLWLIKWLLAIPHAFILLFLWIAACFVTVIAFFAILFTGHYPRKMFDFVVGVLRWTWRVAFYAYDVLGTDSYPPFSLESKEDYPADLDIDYPESLNNGLPLVKWLLAFPHFMIMAAFVGGTSGEATRDSFYYGGLQWILVLIVAVLLLFTGKYHKDIFRLIMGINRWGFRVCAYVGLLTDEYPHFRLWE
jgi:hypothetical protein